MTRPAPCPAPRLALSLLASLLAVTPGMARAAEPPCLSSAEFSAIATYALPSIIAGTTQRCAASLPGTAFLPASGEGLVARYAPVKANAWPPAKQAFLRLTAGAGGEAVAMVRLLPDATQQQLVDALVSGVVAEKVVPETCPVLDRLIALLAPLPPESTGEVIGLVLGLGARAGQGRVGKLTICPASPAATPIAHP